MSTKLQDFFSRQIQEKPVELERTCSICGKTKPIEEFHKNGTYKGVARHRKECKECYKRIVAENQAFAERSKKCTEKATKNLAKK